MNKVILAALAATSLATATPTAAAIFVWNGGSYVSGTTSPNPLLSLDVLSLQTAATKSFGVDFTNASGQVDWQAGAIFLSGGGVDVVNAGLWRALGNDTMTFSSGGGIFTNSGTFRKEVGTGTTTLGVPFVNSGIIDTLSGILAITGASNAFNAGSSFTGTGTTVLTGSASFGGGFSSTNLDLNGGNYTGFGATLTSGSVDTLSGNFLGDWTVASGSTLNFNGSSSKTISGDLTNNGTLNWNGGAIFLNGGTGDLINTGTMTITGNDTMTFSSGGGIFTNSGLVQKTGGTGITTLGAPVVNSGTFDAAIGTIQFTSGANTFNAGSSFTGAGTNLLTGSATFNGGFSSTNLDLNGGNYTGNAAALTGSLDVLSGNFIGDWTVNSGAALNFNGAAIKTITGDLTNNGAFNWNGGAIFLNGGAADLINAGTMAVSGDDTMTFSSGGGIFTNSGLVQKTGGSVTSTFGAPVVNSGTFDATIGTIAFTGGTNTFNAGSSFTGAGTNLLTGSATFNGGFSSTNLDLNGSNYTGVGAVLTSGSVDVLAGNFIGGWTVASGSTLNLNGAATKTITGTIANAGTLNWNGGAIFLNGGSANLTNTGTVSMTGNDTMTFSSGGGTFVNNGVLQKTAGTGTSTIGVPFTNNGTIDVQTGTIALPTNFVNAGTLAGVGTYSVSGTLTNNGTIAPGLGGTGIGTLSLTGNYAQGSSGIFSVGFGPGATSDLFNISGTAALNGTLALNCLGCSFNVGDLITILDSVGDLSGTFTNFTTTGFNAGFMYGLVYDTALDRVRVRIDNVGTPPDTGAVPEPATWAMMLLGFGAMGAMLRRRRDPMPRLRFA